MVGWPRGVGEGARVIASQADCRLPRSLRSAEAASSRSSQGSASSGDPWLRADEWGARTHARFNSGQQGRMAAFADIIEIATVHHLYKVVNGRPLQRPPWYYDVNVQGDGMVDVQSHLMDQVQWLVAGDSPAIPEADVTLREARRWSTAVPLDLYRETTGESEFPEALRDHLVDGTLELPCNGEIDLSLLGVRARMRAEWGQREPPGSGDRHPSIVRGTRCDIVVHHGPETGPRAELAIVPKAGASVGAPLAEAVAQWQEAFPGLGVVSSGAGYRFTIPDALRTDHESHFAMVLEAFLDYVDAGRWPAST